MKRIKKMLPLLSVVFILTVLVCVHAYADGTTEDGLIYKIGVNAGTWHEGYYDENGVWVEGYTEPYYYVYIVGYDADLLPENVVIPETIDGYPVVSLGIDPVYAGDTSNDNSVQAFKNAKMKSVVIPQSVYQNVAGTFNNCSNLESVEMYSYFNIYTPYSGNNGQSIMGLFINCPNIANIILHEGIIDLQIDGTDNGGLKKLKTLNIPQSVTQLRLLNCKGFEHITIPSYVSGFSLEGCSGITSVTLPNGINGLSDRAFSGTSIEEIDLPDSITSIGYSVFGDCKSLKRVKLPKNLTTIPSGTFFGCTSLVDIEFPEHLTKIGTNAFRNCSNLVSVVIPEGVTDIESGAFVGCSNLAYVDFPDSLKYIGGTAFCGTALRGVVFPDNLHEVGSEVFYPCYNLEYIQMPDNIDKDLTISYNLVYNTPTIYCYSYTYGQGWAEAHNYPYILLDNISFASEGKICVPSTLRIPRGSTLPFSPQLIPKVSDTPETFSMVSSNPAVVTVNNDGTITAAKSGSAVITITAGSKSAQTQINVYAKLKSFEVEPEIWLEAGSQYTGLIRNVTPTDAEYAMQYSVSDSSIASVDTNGFITGTYAGNTMITVESVDTYAQTSEVHVTLPITGIDFANNQYSVQEGDRIQVTANARTRRGAIDDNRMMTFSSSNPDVFTVDAEGIVTGVGVGFATLTVQTTSSTVYSASCTIIVNSTNKLVLPQNLTVIGAEAFAGSGAQEVVLPNNAVKISSHAFSACPQLRIVTIPISVTDIADNAFEGCNYVGIICAGGSAAEIFAANKGIPYVTY